MSWTAAYSEIDGQRDDFDPAKLSPFEPTQDYVREQFDAAVTAAVDLIKTNVVGYDKKYNVTLSGHANVGHEPSSEYANDYVSVSISQVTPDGA